MFKNKLFFILFLAFAVMLGCGKKDETKKDEPKKDDKKTTTTDSKTTDKKELKKSDAPKKKETPVIPAEWVDITSPDGKLTFKVPSDWTAKSSSDKGVEQYIAESPDKSIGFVATTFADANVTSDALLAGQLAVFNFNPEGDAIPVETDNVDGWLVVADGDIGGSKMMMYMMSMIDKNSPGNYVVHIFCSPETFAKNADMMENILFSTDIKK